MEMRNLGASGLKVSSLCLGAMTFGEADEKSFMHKVGCSEETAHQLLDRALDAGVNFVDTADVYGQDGLAERVIGTWFEKTRKRDRTVLATKFRFRMEPGPNGTGASRYHIVRACEASLRRLKTDRIDLYQIHCQDVDVPEEETARALDDLVRQGKVLYLGASNYAAYRLTNALWLQKTLGLHRFVALQAQYSLVVRDLEREHVPLCRDFGLGILPWSPLAAGFLTGKVAAGQSAPGGTRLDKNKERLASFDTPRNWRTLETLRQIASAKQTSVSSVALAWLLHKPQVTSVIFGARTIAQLDDNLRAAEVRLAAEDLKRLDDASAFELGYPYDFIGRLQNRW